MEKCLQIIRTTAHGVCVEQGVAESSTLLQRRSPTHSKDDNNAKEAKNIAITCRTIKPDNPGNQKRPVASQKAKKKEVGGAGEAT